MTSRQYREILAQRGVNAGSKLPPAAGKKRKSDSNEAEDVDVNDIDCDGLMMDKNCDQVRRQVRNYLDAGNKVGEFCKAIGVSNNSLNSFLRQNGPMKGSRSHAYRGAWEFFKKREIAGVKIPNKKQKAAVAAETTTGKSAATSIKEAGNSAGIDISAVHLAGEELDGVPVYDSCDEVRRRISSHLSKDGVTQAQFCRDMKAQLHLSDTKMQSNQLTAFRSKKGANQGNTSSVYYAAYVFFEKVRLAQGSAKTKHRLGMEDAWPNGADRIHGDHRGCV